LEHKGFEFDLQKNLHASATFQSAKKIETTIATSMTTTAIHPKNRTHFGWRSSPIITTLSPISMIITNSGTAINQLRNAEY